MKKIFSFVLLLVSLSVSYAQTTPNLGLNLPSVHSPNWNVPLNQNFLTLDSLLSGATTNSNLSWQYKAIFVNGVPSNSLCTTEGTLAYNYSSYPYTVYVCRGSAWQSFGTSALPPAATNTSLGIVQCDGTTISCDSSGIISSIGSGSIKVNGTTVTNANLNGTAPVADVNFILSTFKVSGSDVVSQVPYGTNSSKGALACDGTTTNCSGGVITSIGGGSSGGNPSTTAYIIVGSSLLISDGFGPPLDVILPNVTSYTCNGTICTVNLASAPTTPLTTSNHVRLDHLTSWFAPPTNVNGLDTGVGTFRIASVISTTQFTVAYTHNTGTCASSCGQVAVIDKWAAYLAGDQPALAQANQHGTTYSVFGWMSDLDTNFSAKINCTLGSPTDLIIQGAQNDIANGDTPATIKAHMLSIYGKAHAAGCKNYQMGIAPAQYGIPGGWFSTWATTADVNAWFTNQMCGSPSMAGTSTQCIDVMIDASSLADESAVGHMQVSPSANLQFAQLVNQTMLGTLPPPVLGTGYIGPYNGNSLVYRRNGSWTYINSLFTDWWMNFDPTNGRLSLQNPTNGPTFIQNWRSPSIGTSVCNQMNVGTDGTSSLWDTCVYYGGGSTRSYYQVGIRGALHAAIRLYDDGTLAFPGTPASSGTQCLMIDTNGNASAVTCTPFSNGLGTGYQDVNEIPAPGNPATGVDRTFFNSTSHKMECKTSAGLDCMPTGSGGGSSPQYGFSLTTGIVNSPATPNALAKTSGTISTCKFLTQTSDIATPLTFNIKLAGTSILSGSTVSISPSTASQTITNLTLTGAITVAAGNIWEFDITAGTASWTGSLACY